MQVVRDKKTEIMKKTNILLFFFSLINLINGQEIAQIENIKINSKELNQKREILVYTPQSYNESPYEYYDVIYLFDSQNREFFDYTNSIISFLTNASKKFIVVGITSPYNEKLDYSRRNDFLPFSKNDSQKEVHQYEGNVDNFLSYVKNEVVPYIENNYRTLKHRTAIGHSLGASFVMYSLFNVPELFDNYIAISPNFAFDKERLVDDLYHFDFSKLKTNKYLYLSNANEAENWKEWKTAREKVYSYLNDSLKTDKLKFVVKDFSNETHWSTFPPSLNFALQFYFNTIFGEQQKELSTEEYEITINVKVPNKDDELFITGNQINLGNWSPNQINMNKKSDFERELKVKIHSPAQFKFTKGNWETEAEIKNGAMRNLTIIPKDKKEYHFEITRFSE